LGPLPATGGGQEWRRPLCTQICAVSLFVVSLFVSGVSAKGTAEVVSFWKSFRSGALLPSRATVGPRSAPCRPHQGRAIGESRLVTGHDAIATAVRDAAKRSFSRPSYVCLYPVLLQRPGDRADSVPEAQVRSVPGAAAPDVWRAERVSYVYIRAITAAWRPRGLCARSAGPQFAWSRGSRRLAR